MYTLKHYLLLISTFLVMGCENHIDEQEVFIPTISYAEKVRGRKATPVLVSDFPFNPYYSRVYKDYSICYEREGDFFISVNDLRSGDLLKGILRRGRGPFESTNIHPIFSIGQGNLCLYDDDRHAVFEVDIEASLHSELDSICSLKYIVPPGGEEFIPFSLYYLSDDKLLVLNLFQDYILEDMVSEPYYSVYDMKDGTIMHKYELFRLLPDQLTKNTVLSQTYLNDFDCISPNGRQLFFSMAFLPVCGILDLETDDVKLWRIRGKKGFNPDTLRFQFVSSACSSDNLYALYSGGIDIEQLVERRTDLYIFDWDGNITDRLILDKAYKYVSVSDGKVYLMDYDGYVYTVE